MDKPVSRPGWQQSIMVSWLNRERILVLISLTVLGVFAGGIAAYSTTAGAWAGSDSAVYVAMAHNLQTGVGYRILFPSGDVSVILPPLYPVLLAIVGGFGIPLLDAARLIDILFFAVTTFVIGYGWFRWSRISWLALPVSLLIVVFPTMIFLYRSIMSEPVFIFLSLAGCFALAAYLEKGSTWYVLAAAAAIGASALARFIGLALLPLGVIIILFFSPSAWKRRIRDAGIYISVSVIPNLLWWVWMSSIQPGDNSVHIPGLSELWKALQPLRGSLITIVWSWLPFSQVFSIKYSLKILLILLSLTFLITGTLLVLKKMYGFHWKSWISDRDFRLFSIFGLYFFLYMFLFILVFVTRIPQPDVDDRTLFPLYPAGVLALFASFSLLLRAGTVLPVQYFLKFVPLGALVIGLAGYIPLSAANVKTFHQEGGLYTSQSWQHSQLVQALMKLPPDVHIISNDNGAVLFFTGRMALDIREVYLTAPLPVFTRYGDDPSDETQRMFKDGQAVLVIFNDRFSSQLNPIYGSRTQERIDEFLRGLIVVGSYSDGSIYRYPTPVPGK